MTTGDIAAHLEEVYDTEISRDLVSRVTDLVLLDVREWQARPLDPVYPVIPDRRDRAQGSRQCRVRFRRGHGGEPAGPRRGEAVWGST